MKRQLIEARALCKKHNVHYSNFKEFFRLFDHNNMRWDDNKIVADHICYAIDFDRKAIFDAINDSKNKK